MTDEDNSIDRAQLIDKHGFDPFIRPGDEAYQEMCDVLSLLSKGDLENPIIDEFMKKQAEELAHYENLAHMKFPV